MALAPKSLVGGKYEIVRPLGSGAMGTVYEAVHTRTMRKVALKLMNDAFRQHGEASARFRQEAMAVGSIDHPGVVQVYDAAGDDEDELWIAMELLKGESLAARIERGALSAGELDLVFGQLLDALAAVHRKNIVHRDLKPDNVFLARVGEHGAEAALRVKVLDFGIAKIAEGLAKTHTRFTMGTPDYMAPEQFESAKRVDARSDLYAVGVILYQCLSGRLPYDAESLIELARKVALDPPAPLVCAPSLTRYRDVALACLQKDPSDRPQSAAAVRDMLLAPLPSAPRAVPSLVEPASIPAPSSATTMDLTPSPAAMGMDTRAEALPTERVARRRYGRWALLGVLGAALTTAAGASLLDGDVEASTPANTGAPAPAPPPIPPVTPRPSPLARDPGREERKTPSAEPVLTGVVSPPALIERAPEATRVPYRTMVDRKYEKECRRDLNLSACVEYASSYEDVPTNLPFRMQIHIPACERGHLEACVRAGSDYKKGYKTPRTHADYAKAVQAMEMYRTACQRSALVGCNEALARDGVRLMELFTRACDRGDIEACRQAGYAYHIGPWAKTDRPRALRLFSHACEHGDAKACYYVGDLRSGTWGAELRDQRRAVEAFTRACRGGDAWGCTHLGYAYQFGHGVATDSARAAQLSLRAQAERDCQVGYASDCVRVGTMVRDGAGGIEVDDARAARLYTQACGAGDSHGCNALGYMYEHGRGVTRDVARAATLYRDACTNGVADACGRVRS